MITQNVYKLSYYNSYNMKVKIRKIGNSLGILLPKDTLTLMGLKDGDEIEFETKQKQIELILQKVKQ